MNDVLVSVVIPVYNRAKIVKNTINSVMKQSGNFAVEIVIVDDFSDDRDELISVIDQIIKSNLNPRFTIKLILHTKNLHGGAARNTGIDNSTGMYIAFLDSDDIWHEDKLNISVDRLQKEKVDFVYHSLTYNNKELILPSRGVRKNESFTDYLICNGGSMQTSTLVFNRRVFEIIKFSPELKKYQDFDLIYQCERENFTVSFIPNVLTVMDNSPSSIRISNSFDPTSSIIWFNKVNSGLSERAKNRFVVSRIVKYYSLSGDKLSAFKFAYQNLSKNLTINDVKVLTIFLLSPLLLINFAKKIKHVMLG